MLRISLIGDGFADVDASLVTFDEGSVCCWRSDNDHVIARYRLEQVLSIQAAEVGRVSRLRREYPNVYRRWTPEGERAVVDAYRRGETMNEIAESAGRRVGGIRSRLIALGVIEAEPGDRVSVETARTLAEATRGSGRDPDG